MEGVTLVADTLELKASEGEKEELAGIPSHVDPLAATLTLLGQTIRVTSSTILEDDLEDDESSDSQTFNLSSLTAGEDYVSVDLFQTTEGDLEVLEASKVEREENPSQDTRFGQIEGYIESVNTEQQLINVVNVPVDVSDPDLSGLTFDVGDRVEIDGFYDPDTGIFQPDEVKIDED
jgi:hypothetical protein